MSGPSLDPSLDPEFVASGLRDAGLLDLYSQGSCHVFALACAELMDAAGFRVLTDPCEAAWEDPSDPDNRIDAVVHVMAVVKREGRAWAVDVFGVRPLEAAQEEVESRYSAGITGIEDFENAGEMAWLISKGIDDDVDPHRPLHEVDAEFLAEARGHVLKAFGGADMPWRSVSASPEP